MTPTIGRIVVYVVSEEDAEKVNRRRTDGRSIAARLKSFITVGGSTVFRWPEGAQAHIGNRVEGGMEFPATVVRDWAKESDAAAPENVNLQVFLDGNDVYWATGVKEDGAMDPQPGTWHWPPRE